VERREVAGYLVMERNDSGGSVSSAESHHDPEVTFDEETDGRIQFTPGSTPDNITPMTNRSNYSVLESKIRSLDRDEQVL
jgi:hypothetical protein